MSKRSRLERRREKAARKLKNKLKEQRHKRRRQNDQDAYFYDDQPCALTKLGELVVKLTREGLSFRAALDRADLLVRPRDDKKELTV